MFVVGQLINLNHRNVKLFGEIELKKIDIICIVGLVLSAFPLHAESDLNSCHSISGPNSRLLCYDQLSSYGGETDQIENEVSEEVDVEEVPQVAEAPTGRQWRYSDETSALDNRKDVWLSLQSQNTEGNSIGSPIRATLWLRCMENRTNVLIGFDRYTTENQSVRYRLDDGNVQTQWMETMRGGDGIGIWSGSRAIPFIRGMLDKNEMAIGYDTYTGPVEFVFNISGLRGRINVLADECGWSP